LYRLVSKDFVIPNFSDFPACNDHQFHKKGYILLLPCVCDSRVKTEAEVPFNIYFFLAISGETTCEEQMLNVLIGFIIASDTGRLIFISR
jgi:hypothetical protein